MFVLHKLFETISDLDLGDLAGCGLWNRSGMEFQLTREGYGRIGTILGASDTDS